MHACTRSCCPQTEHEELLAQLHKLEQLRNKCSNITSMARGKLQLLQHESQELGQLRRKAKALKADNVLLRAAAHAQLPRLRFERVRLHAVADELVGLRAEVAGLEVYGQEWERLRRQVGVGTLALQTGMLFGVCCCSTNKDTQH